MKNNMLNKLKSGYEEMEIKPSDALWDQLDQKLDEKSEMTGETSFHWWKYAAAVVLLISVGTIVYFNFKKEVEVKNTAYTVKKESHKTADPVHLETPLMISNNTAAPEKAVMAMTENPRSQIKEETEQKIVGPGSTESKIQQIAATSSVDVPVGPEKIENAVHNFPVVAEARKTTGSYISADDLLTGRDLDKSRENLLKEEKKFGVFNIGKVFHKVDNITFLGVTVYNDPK